MLQGLRDQAARLQRECRAALRDTAAVAAILLGTLGSLPALAQATLPAAPAAAVATEPSAAPSAGQASPSAADPVVARPIPAGAASAAAGPEATAPAASDARIPAAKPANAAHDLSPMGMFLNADPVVKAVMVMLAVASVVTWAVLLVKMISLGLAKRRMRSSLKQIRSSDTLAEAGRRVDRGVGALLLVEAEEELALSKGLPSEGIKERVAIALQRVEAATGKRMASGTGILATIGSIGPFVGLFGTVWGIMGSFIGIANSNTTNLAVVAPGIAEALLATGIGLVAAIPAVVFYNALSRSIVGYRAMTGDAVALIMRHLSRDLDRREHGGKSGMRLAAE